MRLGRSHRLLRARPRARLLFLLTVAAALTTLGFQGAGASIRTSADELEVDATATNADRHSPRAPAVVRRQAARSQLLTQSITLRSGATAYWLVHDSPTTEVVDDGVARNNHRVIRWGPGGLYSETRRTYAVFGFRLLEGSPGRMYDFHTQPADVGGWFPPCSNGVAPLAIDYQGDARGLRASVQPEDNGCDGGSGKYHFPIFTQAEAEARRGQWVWLWAEIIWGRRDLGTKGALKIWVAGEDRPRVNVSGINTHYRAQNQITFWEGMYHVKGSRGTSAVEIAASRFGRTPEEAYADVPVLYQAGPAGAPGGASSVLAPRLSTEAVFLPDGKGRKRVVTDRGCRTSATPGRLEAKISSAKDSRDTAVVVHTVQQRQETVIGYKLRVAAQRLTGRLVLTQLRGADGKVLAEIYADKRGSLRLSTPARGLRRRGYDSPARVPISEGRRLELRLSSSSLLLAVDGRLAIRLDGLRGPRSGAALSVRIGIDSYEGRARGGAIRAVYDHLVVGTS